MPQPCIRRSGTRTRVWVLVPEKPYQLEGEPGRGLINSAISSVCPPVESPELPFQTLSDPKQRNIPSSMPPAPPRSTNACDLCRRRKVKCSGEQPCRSCTKHGWECVYRRTGRKRFSEAQVKDILDELQSYKDQLDAQNPISNKDSEARTLFHNNITSTTTSHLSPTRSPTGSCSFVNPSQELPTKPSSQQSILQEQPQKQPLQSPERALPNQPSETGSANDLPQTQDYNESLAAISPATDLTSGPAFECQVRSLLNISNPQAPQQPDNSTSSMDGSKVPMDDQWSSMEALVKNANDPSTPSLEESQLLLDQFLYYLGCPESRARQKRSHWYIEYLLVMAMARLMNIEKPSSQPPGSELFGEAMRRLPPMHELNRGGVLTVEILTLITIYLQWCDRKHDAYLHIGLAIRLSIALRLNLPESEQKCLPSQSTHRLRLWWTVYMLDRRLSSSLGLAAGADERQLRAVLPKHTVGFQSPTAMNINIWIAQITDDIMSSLYGNTAITQLELVQKVQETIQKLHDVGRSFPSSLLLDFSRPLRMISRTGASLYLMLLQAIILCTRPMLLRKVRIAAQRRQLQQPSEPEPDSLARLCETCNEAATRSLAILYALRQQGIIPRYGFFDLDATFSAAFVLVMVGFIDNSNNRPPPALIKAFEVLQFLSRSGNFAAEQRFQDIAQSCLHVWPTYAFDSGEYEVDALASERECDSREGAQAHSQIPPQEGNIQSHNPDSIPHHASLGESQNHEEMRLCDQVKDDNLIDSAFDMQGGLEIDFSGEAEDIYSSFNHPTLPLTGVDYMDWLEIEKLLNAPAA